MAFFEITYQTAISVRIRTDTKNHLQPTKTHLSPGYGYGYTQGANHHIFRILAGTSPPEAMLSASHDGPQRAKVWSRDICRTPLQVNLDGYLLD